MHQMSLVAIISVEILAENVGQLYVGKKMS